MSPALKICENMRGNSPPMLSFDGNSLINLFPDG